MYVDDFKLAGKTKNRTDLENSHGRRWLWRTNIIFDHVYLGCTQRECQISKDIVTNYRDMFEFRISAGAKEKLPTRASGKHDAETIFFGPMTWKVTQRTVWNDVANLQNKTTQHFFKVATPFMDDHQFNEEENESAGELSSVCSQMVLKCLYLARIGRPEILWSVKSLHDLFRNGPKLVTNA